MGQVMNKSCIILIGMPGAGKSTVGPLLAERKGLSFKDTDTLVKQQDGRELKTIVVEDGFEAFLEIQQKAILSQNLNNSVVATGGSVVKSDALMRTLKSIGTVIYLQVDFELLQQRLATDRKLARAGGQSFKQVFDEREPLYIKYADSIIECTGHTPEEIVEKITGVAANK